MTKNKFGSSAFIKIILLFALLGPLGIFARDFQESGGFENMMMVAVFVVLEAGLIYSIYKGAKKDIR